MPVRSLHRRLGPVPRRRRTGLSGLAPALVAAAPWTALAHAGHPPATGALWTAWTLDPLVTAPLLLFCVIYVAGRLKLRRGVRRRGRGRIRETAFFAGGVAALAVALISPLDGLGEVLFSAHMAQHMVLMAVAAPLLVLGKPLPVLLLGLPEGWRRFLVQTGRHRPWRRLWAGLSHPVTAAALQMATLWIWHSPGLVRASLASEAVHVTMHASMLATALLFWWSVVRSPALADGRVAAAIVATLLTMKLCGILGAILNFAPAPLYGASYAGTTAWGFAPLTDQQFAGVIMWATGEPVYFLASVALVSAWFRRIERRPAPDWLGRRSDGGIEDRLSA